MTDRETFGAGNFLGLAAVGIPLDIFQLNREIATPAHKTKSEIEKRNEERKREREARSNDGIQIDISGDISRGIVVSVWENGYLITCERFEDHWWGKPRNRKAKKLYQKWLNAYQYQIRSVGAWPFLAGW